MTTFVREQTGRRSREAFTLIETLIVLVMLGTVLAMALPKVNTTMRQQRVIAAAGALSSDIESAFSLAARQRRPVRVSFDAGSGEIRFADRATGTVVRRRPLRLSSEYRLDAVTLTPALVDLFPNGVASAPFYIRLTNGAYRRDVAVTRTGLTRVSVP